MSEKHYYYLHTNGDLISKKYRPDDSDFVRRVWQVDLTERMTGYIMLVESAA